jgi:hypothetical protein
LPEIIPYSIIPFLTVNTLRFRHAEQSIQTAYCAKYAIEAMKEVQDF